MSGCSLLQIAGIVGEVFRGAMMVGKVTKGSTCTIMVK
jgi:hypothetical protein